MKKKLTALLTISALFALAACGPQTGSESVEPDVSSSENGGVSSSSSESGDVSSSSSDAGQSTSSEDSSSSGETVSSSSEDVSSSSSEDQSTPVTITYVGFDAYQYGDGYVGYEALHGEGKTGESYTILDNFQSSWRFEVGDLSVISVSTGEVLKTVKPGESIILAESIVIKPSVKVKKLPLTINGKNYVLDLDSAAKLPATTPEEEGKTFVCYEIEEDESVVTVKYGDLETKSRVFTPGQTVYAEDFVGFEKVTLVPRFIDNDEITEVSSFEELLSTDSDAIISIIDDIDAEGEDVGTGIGDGEFSGIILGNGHTISNFTIDADDEMVNSGLIDYGYGVQVFDLNVESVELNSLSSYGAGIIVGENDGYTIMSNVNVSDITVNYVDYITWSSSMDGTSQFNNSIAGLGGLVGVTSGGYFTNCSFGDSIIEIDVTTEGEAFFNPAINTYPDEWKNLTFGGLCGASSNLGEDENVEFVFRDNIVGFVDLTANDMASVRFGGVMGDGYDDLGGVDYIGNWVMDVAFNFEELGALGSVAQSSYFGGLSSTQFFETDKIVGDKAVEDLVKYNIINDVTVNVTNAAESNNNIYAGGLFGSLNINKTKTDVIVSDNSITGFAINIEDALTTGSHDIGGLFGDVSTDSNSTHTLFVNENEAYVQLNDKSPSAVVYAGGLLGFCAAYNSAVVLDNNFACPIYLCETSARTYLGGLLALFYNADYYSEIANNFALVYNYSAAGIKSYASFVSYEENAYGDSETAHMVVTDNRLSQGSYGAISGYNGYDEVVGPTTSEEFFKLTGWSQTYWEWDAESCVPSLIA